MTEVTRVTLRPLAGDGVLTRVGELILLCGAEPRYDAQVAALLDAVADVAAAGGDGRRLGRRLAGLLSASGLAGGEAFPPLCALGSAGRDLAVLVHGSAVVEAVTAAGTVRLAGSDAVTWVDRVLTGPVQSVRAVLSEAGDAASPDRWTRLDHGVVRAGGLILAAVEGGVDGSVAGPAPQQAPMSAPAARPVPPQPQAQPEPTALTVATEPEPTAAVISEPEPTAAVISEPEPTAVDAFPPIRDEQPVHKPAPAPPPAAPPPAAAEPVAAAPAPAPPGPPLSMPPAGPVEPSRPVVNRDAPFQAVLLVGAERAEAQRAAPLPPAGAVDRAGGAPDAGPTVLGIYCKNDHFNDPRAPYCAVCGISMVQATHVARPGPRPPLGVLVLDDGATFRLDAPYVVGREPERDTEVVEGRARALRISDRDGVVSRVHARVELDGWDIKIVDLGSANGTQVSDQGRSAWVRIPPRTPVPIRPGTRVLFGHRGIRYESHRNP